MRRNNDVRVALAAIINLCRNILDLLIKKTQEEESRGRVPYKVTNHWAVPASLYRKARERDARILDEMIKSSKDIEGYAKFLHKLQAEYNMEREERMNAIIDSYSRSRSRRRGAYGSR